MSRRHAGRAVLPRTLAALVLFAVPAAPQEATPAIAEPFVDRIEVHLASLEVLVTDRDGNPVSGLTRDDFEVLEDGEPVALTHFFEVREGAAAIVDAAGTAQPEPATRNLLLVVYLDLLNLAPESRNQVFTSLREFIHGHLGADDRVMLVTFDGQLRIAERFTRDPAVLEARLAELERELTRQQDIEGERRRLLRELRMAPLAPRPRGVAVDMGDFDLAELEAERLLAKVRQLIDREVERVDLTVHALARFTSSLAGLRGRKAVLYVSHGMPVRPGEGLVRAWVEKYENWANQNQVTDILRQIPTAETMPPDVGDRLRALVRQASVHQVSFYTLAPPARGAGFGGLGAENRAVVTTLGPGSFSSAVETLDVFGREASLMEMAAGTGGLAFTRTYNLAGLLDRVTSDFRHFYSLGYTPRSPGDGEYHEVEVRVRGRRDLVVRHTDGYRELDPLDELRQVTLSALRYAVDDNPLGLGVREGRHQATAGGQYRVPILLAVPFERLALLPQEGGLVGKVTAFLVVEDDEGRMSPLQRIELPIHVVGDRAGATGGSAGYEVDLVMRRGRHRVAVGVRDEVAGVESSLSFEVDVGQGRS